MCRCVSLSLCVSVIFGHLVKMMAASNDRLRQICSHVSSTALPEGEHSCTRSRQPAAQSTAASTDSGGLSIDLSGRIALVTGATGQLGRTMVRTLARAGADLAVHYRGNRSRAESLCQEVRAIGGRAVAVYAAVDDEASVNAMRDAIVSGLGATPDIVVANAVQQSVPARRHNHRIVLVHVDCPLVPIGNQLWFSVCAPDQVLVDECLGAGR